MKLRRGWEMFGRAKGGRIRAWAGRLGVLGFAFFLVKGLLWLAIPWFVAKGLF
jgi:hypothetical protein